MDAVFIKQSFYELHHQGESLKKLFRHTAPSYRSFEVLLWWWDADGGGNGLLIVFHVFAGGGCMEVSAEGYDPITLAPQAGTLILSVCDVNVNSWEKILQGTKSSEVEVFCV